MTQIILGGIPLPEASFDKYSCWEEELAVQIEMISGRMVTEVRGWIWKATWSYDSLDNETTRRVLAVLRSGKSIQAAVLPDNSDEMVVSLFLVERLTPPSYLCEDGGRPSWHGLGFTLREVEPHA